MAEAQIFSPSCVYSWRVWKANDRSDICCSESVDVEVKVLVSMCANSTVCCDMCSVVVCEADGIPDLIPGCAYDWRIWKANDSYDNPVVQEMLTLESTGGVRNGAKGTELCCMWRMCTVR